MAHSDFLQIFHERGFFNQCTDEEGLDTLFKNKSVPAYIGFDCTASSLHVGNLLQIMILRWLQKCGHKPIILLGGGTTKVGDPSGKDESRQLLDDAAITANMEGIHKVFEPFITFGDGASDALLVNNNDWLASLSYIEFLRDIGPHFSINRMLTFDSVKLRLEREQTLSFLEFNYMLLQAYDFVELHKHYDCRVQIGGSDQWGNIINGIELNRRLGNKEVFGLTAPLIANSSGAKMGKTASGAIWLTSDKLPAYDYWQFWRNTEDQDVGRFLKLFTELPLDEISRLEALQGAEINEAKIILANEATALCHGKSAADTAAQTAQQTFQAGAVGDDLPELLLQRAQLAEGIPVYKLFTDAGICATGGEAKRIIKGGGGKVNDQKIADAFALVDTSALNAEGFIKLSAGKKKHAVVRISDA